VSLPAPAAAGDDRLPVLLPARNAAAAPARRTAEIRITLESAWIQEKIDIATVGDASRRAHPFCRRPWLRLIFSNFFVRLAAARGWRVRFYLFFSLDRTTESTYTTRKLQQ
jgi:hypothetical protein